MARVESRELISAYYRWKSIHIQKCFNIFIHLFLSECTCMFLLVLYLLKVFTFLPLTVPSTQQLRKVISSNSGGVGELPAVFENLDGYYMRRDGNGQPGSQILQSSKQSLKFLCSHIDCMVRLYTDFFKMNINCSLVSIQQKVSDKICNSHVNTKCICE